MAGSHVVSTLDVAWDILDECSGISLDIGGSVVKVTYIDKDDWVEPKNRRKGSSGKLRFSSFSREQLDDAFKFMKSHVHIQQKSPNENCDIYTTGVGGYQFALDIQKQLNVKTHNLHEFDCFVQGFVHLLKRYTRKQIVHDPYKPACDAARKLVETFTGMIDNMEGKTNMQADFDKEFVYKYPDNPEVRWDKPFTEQKDVFPCLLAMLGSGFGMMLINEDGSFATMDASNRGGRTFVGQGSLMTGVKTYDELLALSAKGQVRGVSTTTVHLTQGVEVDDGLYGVMKDIDEMVIYCFGQTAGKDKEKFKKEDIARGLLHTMALDIVQTNHLLAHISQVKHVFFCGSFIQHPLVRQEITTEWLKRDSSMCVTNPFMRKKQVDCHFLKQGSHLGSLGAFLNSKYHFLNPESNPVATPVEQPEPTGKKDGGKKDGGKKEGGKKDSYKASIGM